MKCYLTLAALLITTIAYCQVDSDEIKRQAIETAEAVKSQDYETLIGHTYPKVLEIIGGREKMISILKKGNAELIQQGITFDKVIIGTPSETVVAGNEIHCLVPEIIFMKKAGEKYWMKSESVLMGLQKTMGNTGTLLIR